MVTIDLDKTDLVNMICGSPLAGYNFVTEFSFYLKFTGNQWNENWDWKRDDLQYMSEHDLIALYNRVKNFKDY